MGVALHPPALIEPAIIPCCPLAGGSLYKEHGLIYFTGWELAHGHGMAPEHRIMIRTATPLEVARVFARDLQVLLNGGTH